MANDVLPGSSFMEDFYAECEDHLRDIRRSILVLENEATEPAARSSAIESMFRSFHSLKGILGMAGFQVAEKLAHQTEEYLRGLSRREVGVTPEGLDTLIASTAALDESVLAQRDGRPVADQSAILARLAALGHEPGASGPHDAGQSVPGDRVLAATRAGTPVWQILFSPL